MLNNLVEENVSNSPAPDRDTTMSAIDWKKRNLATKIINNPPPVADGAMERHIKENTQDGVYPWTDSHIVEDLV
ncbi:MAG: hypothetical protein V3S49_04950 [Thermodesulfobacteriota bacterium]